LPLPTSEEENNSTSWNSKFPHWLEPTQGKKEGISKFQISILSIIHPPAPLHPLSREGRKQFHSSSSHFSKIFFPPPRRKQFRNVIPLSCELQKPLSQRRKKSSFRVQISSPLSNKSVHWRKKSNSKFPML
jgi:hypothetical protein